MHTNFDSAIKEFFAPLTKDGYSLVGYDISELTKDYYGYHLTYKRKVNDFISIEFSFDFISGHSKEEYMNILADKHAVRATSEIRRHLFVKQGL